MIKKRGIAVFLVIGMLFLFALTFFWLHVHSLTHGRTMFELLEEQQALSVAEVIARIYLEFLEDVFINRTGCEKIYSSNPFDPSNHILLHKGRVPDNIEKIVPADLAKETEFIEAINNFFQTIPVFHEKLCENQPFSIGARFVESVRTTDRTLIGKIKVSVEINKKSGHPDQASSYRFSFFKSFKLTNILDPVVSKFTLFVRNVPTPEHYNILNKGFQQDAGDRSVLTLINDSSGNASLRPVDGENRWLHAGWVFLGGNEVFINIDGSQINRRNSEQFIFFGDAPFGQNETGTIDGDFYPGTSLFPRYVPMGANSMWLAEFLQELLGEDTARLVEKPSVIRLFGDRSNISPTLVLGNVFARWAMMASLIYDEIGQGAPNHITVAGDVYSLNFPMPRIERQDYNPRRPPDENANPILATARGSIQPQPPFLLFIDGLSDTVNLNVPENGLLDLMPNYEDYFSYMSKLSTDHSSNSRLPYYNSLYDMAFSHRDTNRVFPAPQLLSNLDYPNTGENIDIPYGTDGTRNLLSGVNLIDYDPCAPFTGNNLENISHLFDNQQMLKSSSFINLQGNVKRFDKPGVIKINGDLNLNNPSEINAPVKIISRGNIEMNDIRTIGPAGKMVLMSLEGSVTFTGTTLEATVIAPSGTLRWQQELDMKGSLFVNELNAYDLSQHGGKISYNESTNPANSIEHNRGYIFITGPYIESSIER